MKKSEPLNWQQPSSSRAPIHVPTLEYYLGTCVGIPSRLSLSDQSKSSQPVAQPANLTKSARMEKNLESIDSFDSFDSFICTCTTWKINLANASWRATRASEWEGKFLEPPRAALLLHVRVCCCPCCCRARPKKRLLHFFGTIDMVHPHLSLLEDPRSGEQKEIFHQSAV